MFSVNWNLLIGTLLLLIVMGAIYLYGHGAIEQVSTAKNTSTIYCSSGGMLTNTRSIQSHRSYCLQSLVPVDNLKPNTPTMYSFRIVDDQGDTLKDLDVVHTKIMHFIAVRKDLAEFQHVHPDFTASTGVFTFPELIFPSDGAYRLFADFTPSASQMGPDGMKLTATPFQDVNVGDLKKYLPKSIGTEEKSKTFGQYQISLALRPAQITAGSPESLTFAIQKDGKPVKNLEQYLGALGHAIILREGTLAFLHAHAAGHDMSSMNAAMPQTGQAGMKMDTGGPTINFETSFPEAGNYKIFMQFQHEGNVVTADFVVNVKVNSGARGKQGENTTQMNGMSH